MIRYDNYVVYEKYDSRLQKLYYSLSRTVLFD